MKKKLALPDIDLADSKFIKFESTQESHLIVHLKSWDGKRLKFIFFNTIRFSYDSGQLISELYEVSDEYYFLEETIRRRYKNKTTNHLYKAFVIESINQDPFIQLVAEKVKAIVNWTRVMIDNAKTLSGDILIDFIKIIANDLGVNYVIFRDLDGVYDKTKMENEAKIQISSELNLLGENLLEIPLSIEKNSIALEMNVFFKFICAFKQIYKGKFFLFYGYPENWSDSKSITDKIIESHTTIDVKDSQFVCVYTPYQEVEESFKNKYLLKQVEYNWLENLTPET